MSASVDRDYLSCAETAKLIRAQLKTQFPGVKFSVRSSTYSGGASIDVRWTDGPTEKEVDRVVGPFEGARFDGMIDMAYYASSWLNEDGSASVAHVPGTEGQRGSHTEFIGSRSTGSARLVHFGADYIHTNRTHSEEFLASLEVLAEHNGRLSHGGIPCPCCCNWIPVGDCWTAPDVARDSVQFVCSARCAARFVARQTSAVSAR